MDADIVSLTNSFIHVNPHLQVKMSASDIGKITNWIQMQLLRERQSWKEKLDHALSEIERQRKVALVWEAKCESSGNSDSNADNISTHDNLSITIEEQMNHIRQLEKRNKQLSNDRNLCLEILKIEPSSKDMSLFQILRQVLKSYDKEAKRIESEAQKSLVAKQNEIDVLRREIEFSKRQANDRHENSKHSTKFDENAIQVLCYTNTDDVNGYDNNFDSNQQVTDTELRSRVDSLYKDKLRLNSENKRLRDLLTSVEDEVIEKETILRKYERQIKSLKFESTYNRNDNSRKVVKPGKKVNSIVPLDDQRHRRHVGVINLGKIKTKYSSLPSLPLSRSAEGAVEQSSTPIIQTAKTAVHRCLRCNKLYRLMDNNKFSCHYHRKGKIREELIAPNGQVIGINYRWECCNKSSSYDGCCVSQHV